MSPVAVIEAPSILGLKPTGVETLPDALKRAGLIERLHARHAGRVEPETAYDDTRDSTTLTLNAAGIAAYSRALADTVGYANPAQVKRLFSKVKNKIGNKLEGAHFHNTRGLGLANALAAYEEGVRNFDSSMGGLGGCPFAPGASGNVITEDLVFMFESMGVRTGIDLQKLFVARKILAEAIPAEPIYGHTPVAGLPKGFRAAA